MLKKSFREIVRQTLQITVAVILLCSFVRGQTGQKPLTAEDYYKLGLEKANSYQCKEAIGDFSRAIQLNPHNARFYKERGECLTATNEYAAALADLSKAIQIDPNYVEAYVSRGNVYFLEFLSKGNAAPDKEKAFNDFNRAIALNPQCSECYYTRAKLYFWARDTGERIFADLGKAIELDPLNKEYLMWRVSLYMLTDEYQKSISDCNVLLKINPQDADFLLMRGQSHFSLGDYQKAVDDYTLGLEVKPVAALAFLKHRAKAYRAMGKIAEADADEKRLKGQ